ncbi:urease isoform X1, partial [Tanacetum coccineum]
AALDCSIKTFYGLNKKVTSVKNVRKLTKLDMKLNDALPNIEVDPETYAVTADGVTLTCAAATTAPFLEITSYFRRHNQAAAEFTRMRVSGAEPTHITFVTLLSSTSHAISFGASVHGLVCKLGYDTDNVRVG